MAARFPGRHRLHRPVRAWLLLAGMLVSACGDDMAAVAFSLRAAQTGASGLLAAILVAQSLPAVLLGLLGGVVVDRHLRWWWWPLSLLAQAGLFGVMALALQPAVIVGCVALVSAISSVTGPVASKLVAHHSDDPARVGGHLAAIAGLSQTIGYAAGGIAFGANGLTVLLVANAISFVVLAAAGVVAARGQVVLDEAPASHWVDFAAGFRRLASRAVFGRGGLVLVVGTVLATSIEGVCGVFALTHAAGWPASQVGLTWALWGVGVILGSQFGRRVTHHPRVLLAAGPVLMGASFCLVAGLLPPFWMAAPLYLVGGAANGGFNAAVSALILGGVPEVEQGRAWAAFRWIVTVAFLLGYGVGGLLGARHAVAGLALSGGTALALGLGAAVGQRRPGRLAG